MNFKNIIGGFTSTGRRKKVLDWFLKEFGLPELSYKNNRKFVITVLAIAVSAFIIRILFWAYTHRVWEDALITVLHSENFARGVGLTHSLPLLHGFTSPISVLIPLIGDIIHVGFGLSLIKFVSALCAPLAVLFMAAILKNKKINVSSILVILGIGYIAFEHHQILWGMSGMETEMVTLILMMTFYYMIASRYIALGVSLGLCMYARPDFLPLIGVILVYVLFTNIKQIFKVAIPAAVLYIPWLIFTTLYYGSPIPQTIIAKSTGYQMWWKNPTMTIVDAITTIWRLTTDFLFIPLGPSFGGHGTGFTKIYDYGFISHIMLIFFIIGTLFVFIKRKKELLPIILFCWGFIFYYVILTPVIFGWYVVPLMASVMIIVVYGINSMFNLLRTEHIKKISYVFAIIYLLSIITILPLTFRTEKQIQTYIENPIRREIGTYIRDHIKSGETVGTESLGYVGYYSHAKIYDWPGLNSKEVTSWAKTEPLENRNVLNMFSHFRPTYIVAREPEYNAIRYWADKEYEVVHVYKPDPLSLKNIFLIERNTDTSFYLLKKL